MGTINTELYNLETQGLLRKTFSIEKRDGCFIAVNGVKYIDFSSNNYLGLASHERIINKSIEYTKNFGTSSSASRLLSGTFDFHEELESNLSRFKNKEAAIVFNTGYQANIGIITSIVKKGDVIFSDKLNHASIIDAIKLSGIDFFRFKHNDINDLESVLKKYRKSYKNALLITESVFSMDGDVSSLKEIVSLKKIYDFEILVDEAHATGVFGANGSGIVEELNLSNEIDYIMGTFSKGLGSFGAYLACSSIVKKYLINKSRAFIYSTSLPACIIGANIESIKIIKDEPHRRKTLLENSSYFKNLMAINNQKIDTQIIPIIIGDAKMAVDIANKLKSKGYWVMPVRYPTVPMNQARLRISISFNHSKAILKSLALDIKKFLII